MLNTKIEWTNHTVNFWWGCKKKSPACANCYAEALDKRYHGGVNWQGKRMPRLEKARAECLKLERRALKLRECYRQELANPYKPTHEAAEEACRVLCFVESMGDWLDPDVPIEWLVYLLETIQLCPHVTFQLLTKSPELWQIQMGVADLWAAGYRDGQTSDDPTAPEHPSSDWIHMWSCHIGAPKNVWIGATVENQEMADERIPELLKIPARDRFLSCEPLLGPIDLDFFMKPLAHIPGNEFGWAKGIDWVICGGESGPKARPMHPDWARSLRDQCKAAGVPFFFKQWGEWLPCTQIADGDVSFDHAAYAFVGKNGHVNLADNSGSFEFQNGVEEQVFRCGKARSGHLLDGVEYHEFPCVEGGQS
ncbi:MAG: phage Gp37/Gp68 family protein [Clostridiaceae bacterium]